MPARTRAWSSIMNTRIAICFPKLRWRHVAAAGGRPPSAGHGPGRKNPKRRVKVAEAVEIGGETGTEPGWHLCHGGFQDRCLKPLGHLRSDPRTFGGFTRRILRLALRAAPRAVRSGHPCLPEQDRCPNHSARFRIARTPAAAAFDSTAFAPRLAATPGGFPSISFGIFSARKSMNTRTAGSRPRREGEHRVRGALRQAPFGQHHLQARRRAPRPHRVSGSMVMPMPPGQRHQHRKSKPATRGLSAICGFRRRDAVPSAAAPRPRPCSGSRAHPDSRAPAAGPCDRGISGWRPAVPGSGRSCASPGCRRRRACCGRGSRRRSLR